MAFLDAELDDLGKLVRGSWFTVCLFQRKIQRAERVAVVTKEIISVV
jgi:hypothetical protein